ncbi:MAG: hypothetical protein IKQ04_04365 [Oscillospiraceae bacterium]|nr:hypothetical protein [Oscillospiraceae bacterium]
MLGDLWDTISGWMGSTLSSILESILNATIFRLFYYIERILCWIIGVLYQMFEVFAGLVRVKYGNTSQFLINIFFSNKAVSNIYWGMALIGIVLTFGFAIAAVVRKSFDSSGKVQQSLGQIIWSGIRSIAVIVGMTAIMSFVLNGTGVLMQQINLLFQDPYNLDKPITRTFTGEEFAAMGRVFSTIGTYSVVDSQENRYNLNLCYNDIRQDMAFLERAGVFAYSYYEKDQDGNEKQSWQSVLSTIAKSCDLSSDVKVDSYNDGVSRSITAAMEYLRTTANPKPVPSVDRGSFTTSDAHLDRMVFLMGTFRAAKNPAYNKEPAFDDVLRAPYYYGEGDKSIYDFDDVDSDFNVGFPTDYIVVWVASIAIIFDLVVIILNCIARIFNMLFLYLIAPPVIAAQPLDNGGKTKQWMTAFLVQSLSVFGTVIAMRLLIVFLPIIISPQLKLFDNGLLNALAKLVLIYGGFEAAKKSSSILTGILADSAGWQSVQAGDMSSSAGKAIGAVTGAGKAIGGKAMGAAGFLAKPVTNAVKNPFQRAANAWKNLGSAKYDIQASESKKQEAANNRAGLGGRGGGGGGGCGGGGGGGGNAPANNQPANNQPANNPGPGPAPGPGPGPGPANPPPHIPNPPQNLNH